MSSPSVAAALALAETRRVQRARPDPGRRDRRTRSRAASARCRRAASTAAAFIPPVSSRRSASPSRAGRLLGLDVEAAGVGRGHRRQHRRRACSSAGWTARSPSSCTRGSRRRTAWRAALLAQAGATGPPRVFEGRFGLFASHLQDPAVVKNFGSHRRRSGHALGQPQLVVQAVSRRRTCCTPTSTSCCACARSTACGPATSCRSSARSPSSTSRSCASRWRRRRRRPPKRTAACACSTRWPRRWCAGELGRTRLRRRVPHRPGDSGAGAARHLPRGSVVPAAGPVQGRGDA